MKRFLVFSGWYYQDLGGWLDFKGSFDTVEDAKVFLTKNENYEWCQIVDGITGEIVIKRY
jgi:hypothetical protein